MEEKLFDKEFFEGIQRVKLASNLKWNSGMGGLRKSAAKGSSVEFADFRDYIPGDDIRKIDWNAFGRTNKLLVKLFHEEKEGSFHVLLDLSTSMEFGEQKKSLLAARLAGMFGHMVLQNMDRLHFYGFNSENNYELKNLTGMQSLHKYLRCIESCTFGGRAALLETVTHMPFHGKGVTILISDFLDCGKTIEDRGDILQTLTGEMEAILKYLAYHKQEVILVQVLAAEEVKPVLAGTVNLTDTETAEELRITASPGIIRQYEKMLFTYQSMLQELCKKYRSYFLTARADEPMEKVIVEGIRKGQLVRI